MIAFGVSGGYPQRTAVLATLFREYSMRVSRESRGEFSGLPTDQRNFLEVLATSFWFFRNASASKAQVREMPVISFRIAVPLGDTRNVFPRVPAAKPK